MIFRDWHHISFADLVIQSTMLWLTAFEIFEESGISRKSLEEFKKTYNNTSTMNVINSPEFWHY